MKNILSKIQLNTNKSISYFIQVNLGNELQKSGIPTNEVEQFYNYCKDLNLDIIGTMCIPPDDNKTDDYFKQMKEINNRLDLKELSIGMSNDYMKAMYYSATYLRIGSDIFGQRS